MVAKNLGITWDEARQRTNRLAGLGHIIYADPAAVEAANEAAAREALNPDELDDGDRAIMAYKRACEAEGRSSNWQMIADALNMPFADVRRHTEKLISLASPIQLAMPKCSPSTTLSRCESFSPSAPLPGRKTPSLPPITSPAPTKEQPHDLCSRRNSILRSCRG
jgi:hypothetical protein